VFFNFQVTARSLTQKFMTLREVTRAVISLVEKASGCQVLVNEDRSLKTLAAARIARGTNKIHLISYNPSGVSEPDYLICFQCGFILRLFNIAAADRFDFAGTVEGRQSVYQLLTAPDGPETKLQLPPESMATLRDQLFDGLMTQLRSMPIGFRVDSWIMREYPELSDLQQQAAVRQLQENLQVLSPEIKKIAPAKLLESTLAMNAAFAEFWAGRLADPRLALPYKAAGFAQAGGELLRLLGEVADDAAADRQLIDLWGKQLGLTSWYQWLPYYPPSHD
jgi:hypothetical protein